MGTSVQCNLKNVNDIPSPSRSPQPIIPRKHTLIPSPPNTTTARMVTINLAYTAPINRPSQTPVLTASQVWTALEQKVRHPSGFVPLIVHCEEVSSTPATADGSEPFTITRLVSFRGREDKPIKEVCKHYPPTRIDFVQEPGGSKIANYVSQGPSGEETDLFMTFAFEWRHPEVEGGSDEAKRLEGEYKAVSLSVNVVE